MSGTQERNAYLERWNEKSREGALTTYRRRTNKEVITEQVDFSQLRCTSGFRRELELFGLFAFSNSFRPPEQGGMSDLQKVVDELVLFQRQALKNATFTDLESTLELLVGEAKEVLNLKFGVLNLSKMLFLGRQEPGLFDLLALARPLSTEAFLLFCDTLASFEYMLHISLHDMAISIAKRILKKANQNHQSFDTCRTLQTPAYIPMGEWNVVIPFGSIPQVVTSVTHYVRRMVKLYTTLMDAIGITSLSEYELGSMLVSELDSGVGFMNYYIKDGKFVSLEDFCSTPETTHLSAHQGILASCPVTHNAYEVTAPTRDPGQVQILDFNNDHRWEVLTLPFTGETIEFQPSLSRCPHPTRVPQPCIPRTT